MIIENGLMKYYTASLGILQKLIHYKISITAAIVNTTAFYTLNGIRAGKMFPRELPKKLVSSILWCGKY